MSYGLRNLNNVEEGIKKVFDLLKDKGRAGFLDFNHSTRNSLSNIFQKIYLRLINISLNLSKRGFGLTFSVCWRFLN